MNLVLQILVITTLSVSYIPIAPAKKIAVKLTKTVDQDKYWTVKIVSNDKKKTISKSRFRKTPGLTGKLSFDFKNDQDTNRILVYQTDPPQDREDLDFPVLQSLIADKNGVVHTEIELHDKQVKLIPIALKTEKVLGCLLELPDEGTWTVVTGEKTLTSSIINAAIDEKIDPLKNPSYYPSVLAVQKNRKNNFPKFSGSMRVYADKDTGVFVINDKGFTQESTITAAATKKFAGGDIYNRILRINSEGRATLMDIVSFNEANKTIIAVKAQIRNRTFTGPLTIKVTRSKNHPNFFAQAEYTDKSVDLQIDKGNSNYIFIYTDAKNTKPLIIDLDMKERNKAGEIKLDIDMQAKKATLK